MGGNIYIILLSLNDYSKDTIWTQFIQLVQNKGDTKCGFFQLTQQFENKKTTSSQVIIWIYHNVYLLIRSCKIKWKEVFFI